MSDRIHKRKSPLQKASAEFLDLLGWDLFFTLTFRNQVSEENAQVLSRDWARSIARLTGLHVQVLLALELQPQRQVWHSHGLLRSLQGNKHLLTENTREAEKLWQSRAEVVPYVAGGGASAYVVKDGNWSLEIACSRSRQCRRSGQGCCFEDTPWHGSTWHRPT